MGFVAWVRPAWSYITSHGAMPCHLDPHTTTASYKPFPYLSIGFARLLAGASQFLTSPFDPSIKAFAPMSQSSKL